MAAQRRAGGEVAGFFCVQVVPFHSQVAEVRPALPEPPNSTLTPRALSYAIDAAAKTGGDVDGDRCAHSEPFHSHVSLRFPGPPSVLPPNRTLTPRAES